MKKLACRDLGTDCDNVEHGETSEEVKQKMMEHAKEVHPEKVENLTEEDSQMMGKLMDEKTKEE